MKSLIPKGAKSTFVTSGEKHVSLCEFVHASMGNYNVEFTIFSFGSLYSDQKCILKISADLMTVTLRAENLSCVNYLSKTYLANLM